jgi:carboxyl-terminal processing protease
MPHHCLSRVILFFFSMLLCAPFHALAQAATGTVVEYVDGNDFPGAPGGLFFYSSEPGEQASVDKGLVGAFFRTGRTFATGGPTPVCRFYGSVTPGPNSHFFTVNAGECADLKAAQIVPTPANIQQWNFEGNGFNTTAPVVSAAAASANGGTPAISAVTALSCPAGTTMVLRAYNNAFPASGPKNPWDSNHRFARSQADINTLVTGGWRDEGGVFCAPNSSTTKVFAPSAALAGLCVAPRADPTFGDRQGTLTAEKAWVRSYIDETYLWYNEVPDISPVFHPTAEDWFLVLKTPATTASGRAKDRFHFDYDTPTWEGLQQGTESGYGFELAAASTTRPRIYYIAYSEPNSPAGAANIGRGAQILTVDGADLVNGNDVNTLNAGLFPASAGEQHTFRLLDWGAQSPRTVMLTSASVSIAPVHTVSTLSTSNGLVGYILFNDHNYPAEGELIAGIQQLKNAGVQDLVLDLRYNGGGLIYIASQLAYMIAGPQSHGKIFERFTFSDKRSADTNNPDNTYPFFDISSGFDGTGTTADTPLPSLGFNRVFVLTSGNTASASESIINALLGIGVSVVRVGTKTFGKPYGFSPVDNCGFTYFSVEFKGTNDVGYGDYDDGFAPTCVVADDFAHDLGDPAEKRLATALSYRDTGICPAGTSPSALSEKSLAPEPTLFRSPVRENRMLLKRPLTGALRAR